ncbi:YdeI/OmpD-associated family protein [Phytomonospora sp. NPDC050363]|uniref:YdeI/OmpD-associated family protein n=1 Tax=Phytomonospora sp. NPDC050363 TaxID=3155642 RepID=UPI0033E3F350
MQFRAVVQSSGKTATGIEVPAGILDALASGKRPKVKVTLGDHVYRTTVGSHNGLAMIPVSAEVREQSGVAAGDDIEVGIELDTEVREVEVPDDLAAALDAEPRARAFFDGLSYSNKRWHVLQVTGAKAAETRARRIEKSVSALKDGRQR